MGAHIQFYKIKKQSRLVPPQRKNNVILVTLVTDVHNNI